MNARIWVASLTDSSGFLDMVGICELALLLLSDKFFLNNKLFKDNLNRVSPSVPKLIVIFRHKFQMKRGIVTFVLYFVGHRPTMKCMKPSKMINTYTTKNGLGQEDDIKL